MTTCSRYTITMTYRVRVCKNVYLHINKIILRAEKHVAWTVCACILYTVCPAARVLTCRSLTRIPIGVFETLKKDNYISYISNIRYIRLHKLHVDPTF